MGNQTSVTVNGATTTSTYDAADELTAAGGTTYTWDANGNELPSTTNGITTTYAYDPLDRLTGIAGPTATTYTYDGDGLRVAKAVGGAVYHPHVIQRVAESLGPGFHRFVDRSWKGQP